MPELPGTLIVMAYPSDTIGLDVSRSRITAVRLVRDADDITEHAMAEVGLPGSTFDDEGTLRHPHIVTSAVRKIRAILNTKAKHCVIGVPGPALMFTPLQRPESAVATDPQKSIELQISPGLPYPSDEAHTSWRRISDRPQDANPNTVVDLLAFSCRKALPVSLARAVTAGGLRCVDVLPLPVILTDAIWLEEGKTEIVLHIGLRSSTVMLIKNRRMVYANSLNIGGDTFTTAISDGVGVDRWKAERWKRSHSLIAPPDHLDPEASRREPMSAVAEDLVGLLYDLFRYDASMTPTQSSQISRILLAGGGANLSGISSHLNRALNVGVDMVAPHRALKVKDQAGFVRNVGAFALARAALGETS